MQDNRKILGIILLAGLVLRLFLFFHFLDTSEFFLDDDSPGYLQLAENMRQGRGFSWEAKEPFEPNSFRTPGYPVFLLAARTIFGHYEAALLVQILLVVAVGYLIYLIAKAWGQPRLGLWGAGIFLFMPFSIMVSLRYLTQPLFTFGLMLAAWWWLKFLKSDQNRYLWFTAILLPVLALIRPIAIYIYLPFLAGYLWSQNSAGQKINWARFFRVALLIIAMFLLILSPWLGRNLFLFGHFSLSSITSYQLYFYDTPAVYAHNHSLSYVEARQFLEQDIKEYVGVRQFENYMTFETGKVLNDRARHYLTESWGGLIMTRFILFFKFFIRDGLHYWSEWGFGKGVLLKGGALLEREWLAILSLGWLWSLVQFWRSKALNGGLVFLSLVILYFALLTGAVASAGLRFPVEPFIILAGLLGWNRLRSSPNPLSR